MMNERIKELYVQAIQYADSVVPANNRYNDIYYAIVSGKHAELIVKECIEQFAFSVTDNTEIIQDRFAQCRKVAKHFGVE
jgi:hypothetical protein